jgi:hypothetical protein
MVRPSSRASSSVSAVRAVAAAPFRKLTRYSPGKREGDPERAQLAGRRRIGAAVNKGAGATRRITPATAGSEFERELPGIAAALCPDPRFPTGTRRRRCRRPRNIGDLHRAQHLGLEEREAVLHDLFAIVGVKLDDRAAAGRAANEVSDYRNSLGRLLQAMQIIGGALRMGGGGEHGALVVLQDFQPIRDVARMIIARLGRDAEVDAKEGGAEVCTLS